MKAQDQFLKTVGLAEAALDHLKRHQLPATPRHFEFWYSYCAGFNLSLNRAVNDIVQARGRLTAEDLQRLHGIFLSHGRIDEIDGRMATEIADISASMQKVHAEAAEYGVQLATTLAHLAERGTADDTIKALNLLVDSTRRIEAGRRSLEARLTEACTHFDALRSNLESLRHESQNDPLTTLATRKHFDQSIERAVDEAATEGSPLALILTDIDHFKSFNDRYGHQIGDQVLRLVAQTTKQNIKGQDLACRYGGEEFAIILPQTTRAEAAMVGEHIRQAVMSRELVKRSTGENVGHVTVSAGVACYQPGDTPQSLIERADACLYAAKRSGRNRVVAEPVQAPSRRDVA